MEWNLINSVIVSMCWKNDINVINVIVCQIPVKIITAKIILRFNFVIT